MSSASEPPSSGTFGCDDRRAGETPRPGGKRWYDPGGNPHVKAEVARLRHRWAAELHALRERAGWSQEQAAHAARVRRSTVMDIENERCVPDVPTLIALGEIYGKVLEIRFVDPPQPARPHIDTPRPQHG